MLGVVLRALYMPDMGSNFKLYPWLSGASFNDLLCFCALHSRPFDLILKDKLIWITKHDRTTY